MAQADINIEMDERVMHDFSELCDRVGLTMTTAFTAFAKNCLIRHEIPYDSSDLDENGLTPDEVAGLKRDIWEFDHGMRVKNAF